MWWLLPALAGRLIGRPLLNGYVKYMEEMEKHAPPKYTCSRCRTKLSEGMKRCPECKLRFQAPVPAGSPPQQAPVPKADVQPGHRIIVKVPQPKLATNCPKCGADLDKWRDSKLGICSLCREPLK
jgi:predicted amidophosphoribosyltransferase